MRSAYCVCILCIKFGLQCDMMPEHWNGGVRRMDVSMQWLNMQFPASKNTHESPEELLDIVFYVRSILCQRREGNEFLPKCLVLLYLIIYSH